MIGGLVKPALDGAALGGVTEDVDTSGFAFTWTIQDNVANSFILAWAGGSWVVGTVNFAEKLTGTVEEIDLSARSFDLKVRDNDSQAMTWQALGKGNIAGVDSTNTDENFFTGVAFRIRDTAKLQFGTAGLDIIITADGTDAVVSGTGELRIPDANLKMGTWRVGVDPGHTGGISVINSSSVPLTIGAGVETSVLPLPNKVGTKIAIYSSVQGAGTRAITCPQAIDSTGNVTITFAALRDYVLVEAIAPGGVLRWQVIVADGAALS